MAALLFAHRAASEPALAGISLQVDSAGLHAVDGSPAAPGAIAAAARRGLSLEDHRSRAFTEDMAAYDLILTMTSGHKGEVILRHPQAAANVYTLKEYAGESGSPDISDPFGQDDSVYDRTFSEIERAVEKAVRRLAAEVGAK